MNCQEVMEYMQRELDGDLGDIESAKLREHIRRCADCAEMYERLQRLSAELENLPKVTPPFSLVDAILPKLEEIDRAAAGGGTGADGLPAGAEGIGEKTGSAPAAPRRRISRFNLRVLGGVVAAGIVAGVFLVTYDRDRLEEDMIGNRALELASSGSASSDASGSSEPAIMFGTVSESFDAMNVADQYGTETSADAANAGDSSPTGQEASPTSGVGYKFVPDRGEAGGTDSGTGSGADAGTDVYASPGADAAPGSGTENAELLEAPVAQRGESGDGAEMPAVGVIQDIVDLRKELAASSVESVSPDGSYVAVFADSRVIIYDRNGNTRFEGEEREGAIAAYGWTEDGGFFRYEIRRGDGTGETYRIDPAAGTETREP